MNSINPESVQRETFVAAVKWLDEVDSTNSYALRTITERKEFPFLIGTDAQTGGRGRGKNRWWGSRGSLQFSLMIKPAECGIRQQQWPLMSLAVGLAIAEGLDPFAGSASLQLKWPNDVYANGKKIAGILIETVPTAAELVVIGIGTNVNNSFVDALSEVQNKAGSLTELVGETISCEQVLIAFLHSLEDTLRQLGLDDSDFIDRWRKRCFLTGKQVGIDDSQRETSGTCLGIDDDGALRLMTATGLQRFFAGTVTSIENERLS